MEEEEEEIEEEEDEEEEINHIYPNSKRDKYIKKRRKMVSLRVDTYYSIKYIGHIDDTMDDVIKRLIKFSQKHSAEWKEFELNDYENKLKNKSSNSEMKNHSIKDIIESWDK